MRREERGRKKRKKQQKLRFANGSSLEENVRMEWGDKRNMISGKSATRHTQKYATNYSPMALTESRGVQEKTVINITLRCVIPP